VRRLVRTVSSLFLAVWSLFPTGARLGFSGRAASLETIFLAGRPGLPFRGVLLEVETDAGDGVPEWNRPLRVQENDRTEVEKRP
jgi:hypothetical protein